MKKGLKKPMNKQDKQDLELILYRLNEQDKAVGKLEKHFNSKFRGKTEKRGRTSAKLIFQFGAMQKYVRLVDLEKC